jgi:S-DNA-T family DNA segregation ATPase FtsK/SpoIIIE
VFTATSPPGRGYFDGSEVQVAVIGGDPNIAKQAAELANLADAMAQAKVPVAPRIERLAEYVPFSQIAQQPGGEPVIGILDETLEPLAFEPAGVFLVAGPAQSGKTSTVTTMVRSILATNPNARPVLVAARRSQLADTVAWAKVVRHNDDISAEATSMTEQIGVEHPDMAHLVVVLEHAGDHTGSMHEDAILDLVRACRLNDLFVIVEGETSSLSGWDFMQALRQDRYGIVLQPDEGDGDLLFSTSFPSCKRVDFPLGRGLLVRSGRVARVQVIAPD